MSESIRALTIKQPYAGAIAFDDKRVENRGRPARYRGLLAVHAGLAVQWDASEMAWLAAGITPYSARAPRGAWLPSLSLGAVLAVAEMAGCHHSDECMMPESAVPPGGRAGCSPWAIRGQWHWELTDVRPLRDPVPCKGMLGLWRLSEDVEKAVQAQLDEDGDHGRPA